MREVQVIRTEDGSSSLFLPELNETYHSFHGALAESQHVFIKMGLDYWLDHHPASREVSVFEVGFGTGLNALLALEVAEKHKINIKFTTLEPFPLPEVTTGQLNYGQKAAGGAYKKEFHALHTAPWEEEVAITPHFKLLKHQNRLEDYAAGNKSFDLIFFDAFAPNKQAELWEKELLEKVAGFMAPGAVFTTYCAKGQLKRDLKALELRVDTLPGAPGKKEMVRAVK